MKSSEIVNEVKAALGRDGQGLIQIEAYCESTDCAAREVVITIKDHDGTLVQMIDTGGLSCPVCRRSLKLHHARSREERQAEEEVAARMSVNVQMYRRDHLRDPGYVLVPTAVLIDERLPPTPLDWFNK
jgi:hypothetical protein